jgi:hypothetical protein
MRESRTSGFVRGAHSNMCPYRDLNYPPELPQALKSGGRLKVLDDLLGRQYWLVSDEIALKTGSKKVVADLLLVRVDSEGLARLVNVELKSEDQWKHSGRSSVSALHLSVLVSIRVGENLLTL